jgi:hypothetical protein
MDIKIFDSQVDFLTNGEEEFVSSPNDETAIAVLKNTEVIYNDNSGCNLEYCEEKGIKTFKGKINTMGTGVMTSGSLILTVKRDMRNGGEALSDRFSKALSKYLSDKGLPSVRCDNNDVMVDNGKVASGGGIIINGFNYMGYQISVNQDVEAIKNICTDKPMIKQPKALSDFGINTEEMLEFCINYWSKN